MNLPFIEKDHCRTTPTAIIQSDIGFWLRWAGRHREILARSGWWLSVRAGLVDGSVSRLAQLSSRREKRPFTPAGQKNAEKGKMLKCGNIWTIRSWRRTEGTHTAHTTERARVSARERLRRVCVALFRDGKMMTRIRMLCDIERTGHETDEVV